MDPLDKEPVSSDEGSTACLRLFLLPITLRWKEGAAASSARLSTAVFSTAAESKGPRLSSASFDSGKRARAEAVVGRRVARDSSEGEAGRG